METKKWEKQQYLDVLQIKNGKHITSSGYISKLNAKDLLEECEPGMKNQNVCCKAMLESMLEGDGFIVEPKNKK